MAQATLVFLEAALLLVGLFLTASGTATGGLSMLASDILRCSCSNVTLVPRCGESASLRFGYFKFGEPRNQKHTSCPQAKSEQKHKVISKHVFTLTSFFFRLLVQFLHFFGFTFRVVPYPTTEKCSSCMAFLSVMKSPFSLGKGPLSSKILFLAKFHNAFCAMKSPTPNDSLGLLHA